MAKIAYTDPSSGQAKSFNIPDSDATITLGRNHGNDIRIENSSISRQHARIEVTSGIVTFIDLGSSNGSYINGNKVIKSILADGDVLKLGEVELVYENNLHNNDPLDIDYNDEPVSTPASNEQAQPAVYTPMGPSYGQAGSATIGKPKNVPNANDITSYPNTPSYDNSGTPPRTHSLASKNNPQAPPRTPLGPAHYHSNASNSSARLDPIPESDIDISFLPDDDYDDEADEYESTQFDGFSARNFGAVPAPTNPDPGPIIPSAVSSAKSSPILPEPISPPAASPSNARLKPGLPPNDLNDPDNSSLNLKKSGTYAPEPPADPYAYNPDDSLSEIEALRQERDNLLDIVEGRADDVARSMGGQVRRMRTERDKLINERRKLNKQIADLSEKLDRAPTPEALQALEKKVDLLESTTSELNQTVDELEAQLQSMTEEKQSLQQQLQEEKERAQSKENELLEEKNRLETQLTEEKQAIQAELTEEKEKIQAELTQEKEQIQAQLLEEKERVESQLTDEKDSLEQQLRQEKEQIQQQLQEEKEQLELQLRDEKHQIEQQLTEEKEALEAKFQEQIQQLESQLHEQSEKKESIESNSQQLQEELDLTKSQLQEEKDRVAELNQKLEDLESNYQQEKQELGQKYIEVAEQRDSLNSQNQEQSDQIESLQNDLETKNEYINQLEIGAAEKAEQMASLESTQEELNNKIKELEDKLNEAHEAVHQLTSDLGELQVANDCLEESIEALPTNEEHARICDELEQTQQALKNISDERDMLTLERDDLQERLDQLSEKQQITEKNYLDTQTELNSTRDSYNSLHSSNQELSQNLENLQNVKENLDREIETLKKEIEDAAIDAKVKKEIFDELSSDLRKLVSKNQELTKELQFAKSRQAFTPRQADFYDLTDRCAELTRELAGVAGERKKQQELVDQSQKEATTLRTELQEAQQQLQEYKKLVETDDLQGQLERTKEQLAETEKKLFEVIIEKDRLEDKLASYDD